jgi:hypothetical protein
MANGRLAAAGAPMPAWEDALARHLAGFLPDSTGVGRG